MKRSDKERNFKHVTQQACDTLQQLRRLQGGKLSAKAFQRQARQVAGIKRERVLEVQQLLDRPNVSAECRRFIKKVAREIVAGHIHSVPANKMEKLIGAYGSPEVKADAVALGISTAELFCVCVAYAAYRHPLAFGELDNADERIAEIERLQQKLFDLLHELRIIWTSRDVEVSREGHTHFVLAPNLTPGDPEWPRLLVEEQLRKAAVPEEQIGVPPLTRRASLTMATEYLS